MEGGVGANWRAPGVAGVPVAHEMTDTIEPHRPTEAGGPHRLSAPEGSVIVGRMVKLKRPVYMRP
jgi:hypothetical protein